MQAVILVGGEGTRLRPLTSTVPKPVVPLVDRPFMAYMLEWLRSHGVDDVVMLMGYLPTAVRNVLGDGSQYGLRLRFIEEPEPRGTAGALKYAETFLDERFLMLNGDVLTDIDLSAQIAQHESTGAKGTLALVPVPDPSAYGLVRLLSDYAVKEFVEKPSADQIDTKLISAGAYVLERAVLDLIPADRNVSIEREVWPQLVGKGLYGFAGDAYWLDIGTPERYLQGTFDILEGNVETAVTARLGSTFIDVADHVEASGRIIPPDRNVSIEREVWPRLVGNGLFAFAGDAYWLDIGTPERYLQGTFDILEGNVQTAVSARLGSGFMYVADQVETAGRIVPPAIVERGCRIEAGAHVGSLVVLGEGVRVGEGSKIERSVVLNGTEIGPGCTLQDCIVAAGVRIGKGTTVSGGAVLGEGVTIGAHNVLDHGVRVFPGTEIGDGAITF